MKELWLLMADNIKPIASEHLINLKTFYKQLDEMGKNPIIRTCQLHEAAEQ